MQESRNALINKAFVGISRRAELVDRDTLVRTFVDVGPLVAVLSTRDHQIIYGRRGTGKTHALLYLAEQTKKAKDVAVYIDLRYIGSSGGIYGDPQVPLSQRATRLLLDVLGSLHETLLRSAIDGDLDLSQVGPALDSLADASTQIEVVGEVTREEKRSSEGAVKGTTGINATLSKVPSIGITSNSERTGSSKKETFESRKGIPQYRLHFGSVSGALRNVLEAIGSARLLIIFDEWSTVPLELQPYLADLIRRAFFPLRGVTVKMGAIEQRSQFRLGDGHDYVGIEVGADASADIDLDDYMVFDNNNERALEFFQQLLFSHYQSEQMEGKPNFAKPAHLICAAFTQNNAFEDFVRSAEGVPRDAFNILSLAAQRGMNDRISIPTIRIAARTWYQRDKEGAIKANDPAQCLLHWIVDKVIAHRRARAFLLASNAKHPLIDALFDARLLHIIKKGISGQQAAGVRYDAYKLDYGCYVDLLATKSAPNHFLFEGESETCENMVVPTDDYRAIRRAVLDIADLQQIAGSSETPSRLCEHE